MNLLGDKDADPTGSRVVILTPNIFINSPVQAEIKNIFGES
jgi:hypothetical protein